MARGEAPKRVLRTMKRGAEVKKQGELRSAPSEQGDHISEGHFESLPFRGIFICIWRFILFFDNFLLTNDKFGAILYVFNRLKADELKYVKDKEG